MKRTMLPQGLRLCQPLPTHNSIASTSDIRLRHPWLPLPQSWFGISRLKQLYAVVGGMGGGNGGGCQPIGLGGGARGWCAGANGGGVGGGGEGGHGGLGGRPGGNGGLGGMLHPWMPSLTSHTLHPGL